MLNFSAINNRALLGRLLRLPLCIVPPSATVRIVQGPLRGMRWIAGSSNHGCWLGSYELPKQQKIAEFVKPGWTCWDVGANVGFYTLLLSRLVGPQGKVVAFEPVSRNYELLARHVEINRCANVQLVRAALGDFDGEVAFNDNMNHSMGFISPLGATKVKSHRVDTLLANGAVPVPKMIKIDIEGAEAKLLGAGKILSQTHPAIFLATHGAAVHKECLDLLIEMKYSVSHLACDEGELDDELLALSD